jgi:hypothetical protein
MTCHRSETTIPEFLVLIDLEAEGSDEVYEWREHLSSLKYALESWASDCKLAPRTLLTDDTELVDLGQFVARKISFRQPTVLQERLSDRRWNLLCLTLLLHF